MARRMHSTDPSVDPYEGLPSRSEIRDQERDRTAELSDLADRLAALSSAQLRALQLPDILEAAVVELGRVKKGARVRQRRYVARQLRSRHVEAIRHAVMLPRPE